MKKDSLIKINEIYHSIQGESTHTGRPCVFIRLTYCNLRCTYCDSEYAFYKGKKMTIPDIITKIKTYNCNLVEVTGGEPLLQANCIDLLNQLVKNKYEVMLETSGSLPIKSVPNSVIKIVDFKCPSSKMDKKNLWSIVDNLKIHDEIKFVIGDKNDFNWTCQKIKEFSLLEKCTVLFSPVYNILEPRLLSNWILKSNLNVRLQLQTHKYIWDENKKGV